jgi:uncharacterized membrane protein YeiB
MPVIPDTFPHSMKDKEIEECVKGYMDAIIQSNSQENIVIQNYPLVSLGQYELQKRQNGRITRIATIISVVSLIVAAVALYIAVDNSNSSEHWEAAQMRALNSLVSASAAQTEQLVNVNRQIKTMDNSKLIEIANQLSVIEKNTANKR